MKFKYILNSAYTLFIGILVFLILNLSSSILRANPFPLNDKNDQKPISDSAVIYNQLAKQSLLENLEMAKFYSVKAIFLAGDNSVEKALGYHNLGLYYYFKWEPVNAIENYNKSVEINLVTGNYEQLSKTYNNLGAIYNETGDNKKAFEYFGFALQFSRKVADSAGVARALGNMSNVYQEQGDYALSLQMSRKAFKIREMLGDTLGMASTLMNIGITYKNLGDYQSALNMYFKALKVHEKTKDFKNLGNVLYNIANVYFDLKRYTEALKYYNEALTVYGNADVSQGLGFIYNQLGNVYLEGKSYDSSQIYYQKALQIFQKIQLTNGEANVYADMAGLHFKWKKSGEALKFAKKAEDLYLNLGDKVGLTEISGTNADIQILNGNYLQALKFAIQSLKLANEMENKRLRLGALNQLSVIYDSLRQYQKALFYSGAYRILYDSVFDEEKSRQVAELNTLYQIDKKEKEIEIHKAEALRKNAELSRQKAISRSLGSGVFVLFLIVGLIIWAYIQKQKANQQIMLKNMEIKNKNEELFAQNEEIASQRDHIFKQHKEITDSINYAQFMQKGLLPSPSLLSQVFKEHFIMYRPRNVVSGDFYWVKQVNDITVVAVADCTGHSVPGAFMSMLGISLLNEVVRAATEFDPGKIMGKLREHLKQVLQQEGHDHKSRDSIDMALCILNRNLNTFLYSGAKIPLMMISSGTITEFEPDSMTVGFQHNEKENYNTQSVAILQDSQFYLFSDGYSDQFGGPLNHKFKSQNLKSLLQANAYLSFEEQKLILERTFDEWRGSGHQIDDVMVIGFKMERGDL